MQTSGLTRALLQYHSDDTRQRAGSVMPAEEYRILKFRAAAAPLFVLPLGKGQGRSLSMLLQWQLPHCLITELEHYKQCAIERTWYLPGIHAGTPHLLHFGIAPPSLVCLTIHHACYRLSDAMPNCQTLRHKCAHCQCERADWALTRGRT